MKRIQLVISMVATLLVVGCGQPAPQPTPTKAAAASPTTAVEAAAIPTKASAVQQPTVVPVAKNVDWPAKGRAISFIVPFPAGGGTDIAARTLAPLLEKDLQTPVQVVNKAGAGAQTGLTELAMAKPDGYTIGYTNLPTAINIYLDPERKANFNRASFQPVANQVRNSIVATVSKDSPYKTMKELVDAAKANRGKIKAGTPGLMSPAHLGILQLQQETGAEFAIVHFQGGAPAGTALLGGHIDVAFIVIPEMLPHVKSGVARGLGILDDESSELLPDAKTLLALGYKVSMPTTLGISAPAGTPKTIATILSNSIKKAVTACQVLDGVRDPHRILDEANHTVDGDDVMNARLDAVTIGETMVLLTAQSDGRLRYARYFERSAGGAESNFAIALTRLGLRAGWVSRVGDDEFGAYLLAFMRGEGVDVSRVVVDRERPTGLFFKERAQGGDVRVTYYRRHAAATAFSPADLDPGYLASARHLHLTGITLALGASCQEMMREAIGIARKSGLSISFDCNARMNLWDADQWGRAMRLYVEAADWVFLTMDEAKMLCGKADPVDASRCLLEWGPTWVVVKQGGRGAWIATAGESFHQPAEPVVAVVNNHGAGDAFAAGLIGGHLLGWDVRRSARLAAILGAAATTVSGNIEGLPTLREAMARMGGETINLR